MDWHQIGLEAIEPMPDAKILRYIIVAIYVYYSVCHKFTNHLIYLGKLSPNFIV